MTVGGWLVYKIGTSTNIVGIVSDRIYPDYAEYTNIPCVFYQYLSLKNTKLFRSNTVGLKWVETTQDKCELLGEYLYNFFDNSTTNIQESYQGINIESIDILNYIPSVFDENNRQWFGSLDIKVNYYK